MSVETFSIFGLIGVSALLYLYSLEFKKEGNNPLYYFCFAMSSLFLPAITHASYLAVNMTSNVSVAAEANTVTFFDTMSTTTLFVWFAVAIIMGIILFGNFFRNKIKESNEKLTENNRERRV